MPPLISGLETKDYGAATTVLEHKTITPVATETHQVGDQGIVDAYVAVTGVRDDVGDIIEPGAFAETLSRLRPKMCLGHDWNRPIGEPVEIEELLPGDPRLPAETHDGQPWPREAGALWTRSRYMLGTQDGRDAYEHAKFFGSRAAYSIGYVPDKTKVRFTSEKGLRTRRLPKLDLYEYGPVLHGANALARQASVKSAQPDDFEGKIRLVRNMEYWGLPVGTPIRPGMRPRGPIARRRERAGEPVNESLGTVEIDASDPKNLKLKPTARGANKRKDGWFESDIVELFADNPGEPPAPDSDDFEAYDSTPNVADRKRVNRGDGYNPLDMLIANAVTPVELEDDLRNADWGRTVGESADAAESPEVNAYIDDVMDVYREKYNAALAEQHGAGQVDDVAEADGRSVADAVTAETPPAGMTVNEQEEERRQRQAEASAPQPVDREAARARAQANREAVRAGKPKPGAETPASDDVATAARAGEAESTASWLTPEDRAEMTRLRQEGRENEVAKYYAEARQRHRQETMAGEQPSAVDVARDGEAPEDAIDVEQETGGFEPGTVLDESGQPVPRVPTNDAGDYYDDQGNLIAGSSEFDQALNQATDAIIDGDEAALADALTPFTGYVSGSGADGFDPAEEAARLASLPRVKAVAQVQEWAAKANEGAASDFTANRFTTTSAFGVATDDYLATEAARMRGILIERSVAGDPPTDGFVREAAMRLRLIRAEQAKREQAGGSEQDITAPVTPEDTAVIAAEEIADAQDIADASHGISEADDGEFEADSDVADRQDRVAGLLTQADAGAVDFTGYSDDTLRATRADVLSELRLQSYLETRRQQDRARTRQERENADTTPDEAAPADGEPDEEPPGPRPRPGTAGAAEDLADALESGDEQRVLTARARLESSLRRSRSTSEHVIALRALLESGGELDPTQLRALAETLRAETRAKRNANARDRRRVRRFERDRLRALLGDVEAAMTDRGLTFDEAPESREDGVKVGDTGTPGAGVWTTKTDQIDWLGYAVTTHEVSGAHYQASITTKPDGRSTYEWEIQQPDGDPVRGSGDTATADDAVALVELILNTQQARGALPPDAALPQTAPRATSSALPGEVVSARAEAITDRLAAGTVNPLTGLPDPLRTRPTLRPPTVKAFDTPLDVREYLLAQVARETDDRMRERLASSIARIRWDDVTLSPGGGLAVFSMAGERGYHIMHTRSGARADILINGTSSANLPKADQVRIMAIMESAPNSSGLVIDFNQDLNAVRAALDDFGSIAGPDSHSSMVGDVFIGEKLRGGNIPAGLLRTVVTGADNIGWNHRTNPARYPAVKERVTALGYLLGASKADKETKKTVQHGWALANAGAPDATAALYRRRAAELREEFGAKAGDRGAVLLDEIADNLLAMWAPVQSQGDRVRAAKVGERLTVTEDDGVRNYRLLTDMRSTSDYARQSEARVIDEATGATYRLGVWNDMKHQDSLTLWPDTKGSYDIWSLPLSGDEFVVTGGEETAPDTADAVRDRARADIASIPQDVLDTAANLLAESRTETEQRRATGARTRTEARAPRRRAATPPERQPVPGEQHLAVAQGQLMPGWVGVDYSESDAPAPGGFTSEKEWREFIAAERQRVGDQPRGLAVIDNPNYQKVTLSPGGHFVITSDNYVVHARSLQAVWGIGNTYYQLTDDAKLTAAGSMAVATHLERAQLNGNSPDWTKGADEIGPEVQAFTKANGSIVAPAAKTAFQDMLATSKSLRVADLDAFRHMTREANSGYQVPNPSKLYDVQNHRADSPVHRYADAGNARAVGRDRSGVATTKAGQSLAKKIEFEMTLAAGMSKVAPLDAVRRLTRIADAIDGEKIETLDHRTNEPGETLDPAKDLRALAKAITDGYDEGQISPAGMLLRNNFTGTIRFTGGAAPVKAQRSYDQSVINERHGSIAEIRVWRDEDGIEHATFGDTELIQAGIRQDPPIRRNAAPGKVSSGVISVHPDGTFSLTWNDITGMPVSITTRDWEYEPPQEPDVPDVPPPDEVPGSAAPAGGPPSPAQGELNRTAERIKREREGLRDLNAGELRERLDDARRRAATDASAEAEVRMLRRELDARESAEQDVAKAPR